MKYSILDLCPVPEGSTAADAMRNSADLAQHAEALGFYRYWMAEHHNMPGIASAATSVLLGHIAGKTNTIRIGAGGVMLPNHAPLSIAEQFGTLATLYGPRIDLGLGRAPGGDQAVWRAMRRGRTGEDDFPAEVAELMGYLGDADPRAPVQAHPGQGTHVPLWMLGSSLYGAQVAAHFGLPYAFASHFAPDALEDAAHIYRRDFKPSAQRDAPKFMLAINVVAADTDAEAAFLRTSVQQAFARLRSGMPGKLPAPIEDIDAAIGTAMRRGVDQALRISATGAAETVQRQLADLVAKYRPDEVILTGQIHDHKARKRSFSIAAAAMSDLTVAA